MLREQGTEPKFSGDHLNTDALALYGVAAVITFLSPLGFLALMARHAGDDAPRR